MRILALNFLDFPRGDAFGFVSFLSSDRSLLD